MVELWNPNLEPGRGLTTIEQVLGFRSIASVKK